MSKSWAAAGLARHRHPRLTAGRLYLHPDAGKPPGPQARALLLEPKIVGDERGYFMESYNSRPFAALTGCSNPMLQDNHSRSARGVLRGLHCQLPPKARGKLVRVVHGEFSTSRSTCGAPHPRSGAGPARCSPKPTGASDRSNLDISDTATVDRMLARLQSTAVINCAAYTAPAISLASRYTGAKRWHRSWIAFWPAYPVDQSTMCKRPPPPSLVPRPSDHTASAGLNSNN